MASLRRPGLKRSLPSIELMALAFFILYVIFSLLFVDEFANPRNLGNIIVQSTDLIILACGLTFVFMNGSIDFSMTATLGFAGVIGARIMTHPGHPVVMTMLGVVTMLGVGLAIGVINGLAVTRLRMPSFIATIAAQLMVSGAALWFTESSSIGGLPRPFLFIGRGTVLGIEFPVILTALVVAVAAFLLHRTVFGRYIFAVGTNHRTSMISGIPVKRVVFTLFLFSGFLAGLAGIVMTSRAGAGIPGMGRNMIMDIAGAVIIGGTLVTGGKGSIFGTVIGALLIVVLNNSLNLLGVQWYLINTLKGAMIVIVALLTTLRSRSQ